MHNMVFAQVGNGLQKLPKGSGDNFVCHLLLRVENEVIQRATATVFVDCMNFGLLGREDSYQLD